MIRAWLKIVDLCQFIFGENDLVPHCNKKSGVDLVILEPNGMQWDEGHTYDTGNTKERQAPLR